LYQYLKISKISFLKEEAWPRQLQEASGKLARLLQQLRLPRGPLEAMGEQRTPRTKRKRRRRLERMGIVITYSWGRTTGRTEIVGIGGPVEAKGEQRMLRMKRKRRLERMGGGGAELKSTIFRIPFIWWQKNCLLQYVSKKLICCTVHLMVS
jgi:hypothetical protein